MTLSQQARALWQRLSPGLRYALGVYLVARILTSAWAALAVGLAPVHHAWENEAGFQMVYQLAYPHHGRLADLLLGAWYRWDSGWYMTIATQGYGLLPQTVVFPPLYPLLVHLLGKLLGGEYLLAGLIVSNVAYVAALYLLYQLVVDRFSPATARASLVWLALFPTAFYLMAAYAESLFLFLTLLTFWAAQKRRWLLAGLGLYLVTLTRWTGAVLSLSLAWEALDAAGWKPWPLQPRLWLDSARRAWQGLLAAMASLVGIATFLCYLQAAGFMSFIEAYPRYWYSQITWPWVTVLDGLRSVLSSGNLVQTLTLAMLALFLALTVLAIGRLRPSWWLYALASQIFFMARFQHQTPLEGMMRYLVVLFPCFVVLAQRVEHHWLKAGLHVTFGLLQALLLALFVRWLWVA